MKKFLMLVAVGVVAMALWQKPAAATTVDLGNLNIGSTSSIGNSFGNTATVKSFSDQYLFTLQSSSNVTLSLVTGGTQLLLNIVELSSDDGTTLESYTPTVQTIGSAVIYSFASLLTGKQYFLDLGGKYKGLFNQYGGQISVAATPIPPALLLFVTALGGLGFVGYRRKMSV
ncbi:MAG TPA: hypothetical protein VGM43_26595 [Bryobacteraceae bacterium]|jgi:hypothetical protein